MTAPKQPSAKGYDPLYPAFDSPLMRQLRQEAYGEDIGQHSWVTADEFRSDIGRLSFTTSSRFFYPPPYTLYKSPAHGATVRGNAAAEGKVESSL
jgi:hypothetical protein